MTGNEDKPSFQPASPHTGRGSTDPLLNPQLPIIEQADWLRYYLAPRKPEPSPAKPSITGVRYPATK